MNNETIGSPVQTKTVQTATDRQIFYIDAQISQISTY